MSLNCLLYAIETPRSWRRQSNGLEGKTSKRQGGAPIVMPETKNYDYPLASEGVNAWSPYGKKGRGKCSKCGKRGDAVYEVPSEPSVPY